MTRTSELFFVNDTQHLLVARASLWEDNNDKDLEPIEDLAIEGSVGKVATANEDQQTINPSTEKQ